MREVRLNQNSEIAISYETKIKMLKDEEVIILCGLMAWSYDPLVT